MSFQDHEKTINNIVESDYKYGFKTDIDSDKFPKGINETIIKKISKKKKEPPYMLEFRQGTNFEQWSTLFQHHLRQQVRHWLREVGFHLS